MAKRFVILYHGREGSSPIIDVLGRHPDIKVPLFEDLDNYVARGFCDAKTVSRLASYALRYGDFALARAAFASGSDQPVPIPTHSTGFKWRIWGDPDLAAKMLAENDSVVFHLFRSDLDSMALSLYFTEHVVPDVERRQGIDLMGGGHLQFKLVTLSEMKQKEFKDILRSISFEIDQSVFVNILSNIVNEKCIVYDKYIKCIIAHGAPVHAIFYENFLWKRKDFFQNICSAIDVDAAAIPTEDFFKKVNDMDLTKQATNWSEIKSLPTVAELRGRYEALIARRQCRVSTA
jgi:hypothetical protein